MARPRAFRQLVPDAPLHRRTDSDVYPTSTLERRANAASAIRAVRPGLQEPSLVSSCDGAIGTILFAFPQYGVADGALAAAYKSVIAALRVGTRFVVVHHAGAPVESWFAGHPAENVTYVPLPDYVSFTDWAEDGYVALKDTDGAGYLMEPWEFPRAGDSLIADAVADYSPLTASQAPLIFQGGNCLIGPDRWLLGKDYFADSVALLDEPRAPVELPAGADPDQFVRQIFADYVDAGRTLLVVGTTKVIPLRDYYGSRTGDDYFLDIASDGAGTFQPIFHIDMFTTLLGQDVLVGSPRLADELLGTRSPFALDDVYDTIARDLAAAGLTVHRNPLVHRPTLGRRFTVAQLKAIDDEALLDAVAELVSAGASDATAVTIRSWHHVTWNNCLVENSETHGKHVYLPTFGHGANRDLAQLDAHMTRTFEGFGYTVHALADFNAFARRQGVVHCIKKYLDRGD
jgi:hypothetical protein